MSDDDLIKRGDALNAVFTSDFRHEAHDAIAALPAQGVRVKPLVWEPWNLGISQAASVFGTYHTWGGYWRAPNMGRGQEADDPEAAAQADFAARILAALAGAQVVAAETERCLGIVANRKGNGWEGASAVHPYDRGYIAACDDIAAAIREGHEQR
jgi:hypothetical protein